MRAAPLLLVSIGLLAGCERRPDNVPVVVSAIGEAAVAVDPSRAALSHPAAVLIGATAQGLVRFDANGQVEPALAERWIVIDDGRSYIFRLRDARWPNGSEVTAGQVVAALRRIVADRSRNALLPQLSVVDEVVEMTPDVIEVRLKRARPDLLKLFAQPEMAILAPRGLGGTGPFRIQEPGGDGIVLRPVDDPSLLADVEVEAPNPEQYVRLRAERAALAIARFAARESDMVSGGTYRDWPLLAAAEIAPTNRRIDPALGLFGFNIVERTGFLADPANREAVAMAIDRAALTGAFLPDWPVAEAVLPEQLDSAAPPARPGWQGFALDDRRTAARVRVDLWRAEQGGAAPSLRIALPDSAGGRLVWAYVHASLASVGIDSERVGIGADADLRLIDRVAPHDSARWFLVNACRPCAGGVAATIFAAREAPDMQSRARLIAEADAALADDHAFIPLARPLRWSLVALRLRAWRDNARAWHPLNHLRPGTN